MARSIVVVGALTRYILLHSVYGIKDAQINVQHILNRKVMHYKFEIGNNAMESTKSICWVKDEEAVAKPRL